MPSMNDIRNTFLQYFQSNDHLIVPSAPVVPDNDPSLLFTNAGMVQFKNVFTGIETRDYVRAVSSQKCIRAGGKHNDLDNVGYTARHHTFFEMLGNFSFGDYFKEKAIFYAWDFLTKELGINPDRLLVTVYAEDEVAAALWKKIAGLNDDRIIRISTSDNFWSMGETGPCGPCSEIFYDHGSDVFGGPPGSVDEDGDRFVEIWNLVFMQFDQPGDGTRIDLPSPSIDTGMGLERLSAILQGVHDNYEIDLFKNLIAASEEVTASKATGSAKSSHRVIADHLRSCSFMMLDGVTPSNEGRGYVLRRIMRRAMRHANMLGAKKPIMHQLVPALVSEMSEAYPDLTLRQDLIINNFEQEELRFLRTLDRGMKLLNNETKALGQGATLSGDIAFQLYDTYGFPLDLTEDALRERKIKVDTASFNACMQIQKDKARAAWKGSGDTAANQIWLGLQSNLPDTEFTGYDKLIDTGSLLALIVDGKQASQAKMGDSVELVFDKTPFYAESGGQAGDTGQVKFSSNAVVQIHDTIKIGNLYILRGELLAAEIKVGDIATGEVDAIARANTKRNHSATHLLHAALRQRLGLGVMQKGSHVGPDRLRFDFSNNNSVSAADLAAIEAEVNAVIWQNLPVKTSIMSPDQAKDSGAIALFGEKYGDEVRVLQMGEMPLQSDQAYSVELCGGTHVSRTADIGLFRIVSESAVASGIRRIEAITGETARMSFVVDANLVQDLAVTLKTSKARVLERTENLVKDRKQMETDISQLKRKLAMSGSGGSTQEEVEDINGISFQARIVEGISGKDLRELVEESKNKIQSGVVVFIAITDDKASICIGVTADLLGRVNAVSLVRVAAEVLGGKGGGGRPEMAQAGGPDAKQSEAVLQEIRKSLQSL
ncbi:MAG: alanine--tRNA ligase [Robiginitomaculum sp.]|nr:alanine--tRNA ligase [Robiginitomaculum sp.]